MPDIVCLGEALIDFVAAEAEVSLADATTFVKAAGGAPANLACAAARLGHTSAFVGKVGDDPFGRFLTDTFAAAGTDTSKMIHDGEHKTGLAFVALGPGMVPDFTFYRNPSADMMLEASELDRDFLGTAKVFCYGSISLISEPSRSATFAAIEAAKSGGAIVSYDPNLRPPLWQSPEHSKKGILEGARFADIIKLSVEELAFLTGDSDIDSAAKRFMDANPNIRLLLATMGGDGCYFRNHAGSGRSSGYKVDVVDTTGAGDAFAAGALSEILRRGWDLQQITNVSVNDMTQVCNFANAVGALTTTKKGAIHALPTREEALKLVDRDH